VAIEIAIEIGIEIVRPVATDCMRLANVAPTPGPPSRIESSIPIPIPISNRQLWPFGRPFLISPFASS